MTALAPTPFLARIVRTPPDLAAALVVLLGFALDRKAHV